MKFKTLEEKLNFIDNIFEEWSLTKIKDYNHKDELRDYFACACGLRDIDTDWCSTRSRAVNKFIKNILSFKDIDGDIENRIKEFQKQKFNNKIEDLLK